MSPLDALSIVDQACALAPLNRDSHQKVQIALQVLSSLVEASGQGVPQQQAAPKSENPDPQPPAAPPAAENTETPNQETGQA